MLDIITCYKEYNSIRNFTTATEPTKVSQQQGTHYTSFNLKNV